MLVISKHVAIQKERYRARRELVTDALLVAGFRIEHSDAGLYLWASRDVDCWDTVKWCAERGVLVTPGSFYGEAGTTLVRVALTVSDQQARAVRDRFSA